MGAICFLILLVLVFLEHEAVTAVDLSYFVVQRLIVVWSEKMFVLKSILSGKFQDMADYGYTYAKDAKSPNFHCSTQNVNVMSS